MPTLTINFTAANANRISAAFKTALHVPTFDMDDYKQWIINQTKAVVTQEEMRAAAAALPPPTEFDQT